MQSKHPISQQQFRPTHFEAHSSTLFSLSHTPTLITMRFFAPAAALLASLALVSAAPAADADTVLAKRNTFALLQGVCYLKAGLGVTAVEDFADDVLNGTITDLEQELGLKDLGLVGCDTKGLSDLELVGKAVCEIKKGLYIQKAEDLVDSILGGAITALENKTGITNLEHALKIVGC